MPVADDLGVNVHTPSYCMKNRTSIDRSIPSVGLECSPQNWARQGQLLPLIKSDDLTGVTLRS